MTRRIPRYAVVATEDRQGLSAAGSATFDIALRMGGLFLAIIVVAVVIFILKPSSFNIDVGISVLRAMSSVAIMSLGLLLVIVVGEIDLSFGAMYGLGANALAVMWIMFGIPIYAALPLAIASARWSACSTACSSPARDPLLHRDARELQSPLRRLAVDHANLDLQPGLPAARRRDSGGRARFLHRPDGELWHPPDLARGAVDAGAGGDRRLAAAPLAVRLPADRDRRQPGRRAPRPPAGDALQDRRLHALLDARGDRRHPRLLLHPDDAAEHRPLLHVPGLRRGDHRRREPRRRQGHGDRHHGAARSSSPSCSRGWRCSRPGPHVQQLFLGFVTIGAVALDLALTNVRKKRAA